MRDAWCGMRYPACDLCDSIWTCVPVHFQSVMLKIWQYNRNTGSKKQTNKQVCVFVEWGWVTSPKQILHIIDLNSKQYLLQLLLKQFLVVTALQCLFSNMPKIWTTIWCGKIRTILVDQRILKSKIPPNCSGKHLPLTSYSRFSRPFFTSCRTNRYMEWFTLPYPDRHSVAGQIVCRIRKCITAGLCEWQCMKVDSTNSNANSRPWLDWSVYNRSRIQVPIDCHWLPLGLGRSDDQVGLIRSRINWRDIDRIHSAPWSPADIFEQ